MASKRTFTKDDLRSKIAKNLRDTRASYELTQQGVAELFNPPLTRAAIGQWEQGETVPDVDRLAVLAKAYGITIDSLIFGDDHISPRDLTPEALRVARKFMGLSGKLRTLISDILELAER